ncbi:MAG TPA: MFS transporter [Candidatus Binataceae bacterium]|nr:MFS transporter [Candidatus Binataceae bacterium]
MSSHPAATTHSSFETLIPARLDRLPWARFHWLLVVGLGITWVLDGLEITMMGAVGAVLQRPGVLGFDAAQIGFISSCYLAGAVLGSLVFGYLTDRFGRRPFFFISLSIYLAGVGLTAISWNLASFAVFRFITGAGIGGEYAAVNSAIDELIPARLRGRIDLMVNGSFWLGAAAGSASTILILNPHLFAPNLGWRLGFGIGALIGLVILPLRHFIPESPRWLLTHGQHEAAEEAIAGIERTIVAETGQRLHDLPREEALTIHVRQHFSLREILRPLVTDYWRRSLLAGVLMVAQAFVYNAIFFTYALVLNRFYGVPADTTGLYLLPFALGNFLGPIVLGPLFDIVGRRQMIAFCYALSALILVLTGWLFAHGMLSSTSQTTLWTVMFFFASPAASSAYLTVSEIFPLEIRALTIAIFFSVGTAVGGIAAPWLFGRLIDSGTRIDLLYGYVLAGALMLIAALTEVKFGVAAERKGLEEIAAPLSVAD